MKTILKMVAALFVGLLICAQGAGASCLSLELEVQLASTNRGKVGFPNFRASESDPITKYYLKKTTQDVLYQNSAWTETIFDCTQNVFLQFDWSETTVQNFNVTNLTISGGVTSGSKSWGYSGNPCTNLPSISCSMTWNTSSNAYVGDGSCLNGWGMIGCSNNSFSVSVTPPSTQVSSWSCSETSGYGTTDTGNRTITATLSEEYTTTRLKSECEGVQYDGKWILANTNAPTASASASYILSTHETALVISKSKWRLKYILPKDVEYDHELTRTETIDGVTTEKKYTVTLKGTGKVAYHPDEDGEELSISGGTSATSRSVSITTVQTPGGTSCSSSGCSSGISAENGSVNIKVGLGKTADGRGNGLLYIEENGYGTQIANPAAFGLFQGMNTTVIRQGTKTIRQVFAPEVLVDIVSNSTSQVTILLYRQPSSGWWNSSSNLYIPSVSASATGVVERLDGPGKLIRLTVTDVGTSTYDYEWVDANGGWSLTTGGGLRKEVKIGTATNLYETILVKNGSGVIEQAETNAYVQLANIGRRLPVRKDVGLMPWTKTTTWDYYTNSTTDGTNYGQLKLKVEHDGSWEHLVYDTNGLLTARYTPFLNSAPTTNASLCRVFEYDYTKLDTNDVSAGQARRIIQKVLGQEISRRYFVDYSTSKWDIACAEPGAAWNSGSNKVTKTVSYVGGPWDGRTWRVERPDGTMTLHAYSTNSSGAWAVDVSTGVPNGSKDAVIDGTKTSTGYDLRGQMIGTTNRDIGSNLILSQQVWSNPDSVGRYQTLTYLDGRTESTAYGCCGIDSTTDKDGVTTSYGYDALKRRTTTIRNGITRTVTYDSDGRVLSQSQTGTNGTTLDLGSSLYNTAGDLIGSYDALGRTNISIEVTNSSGGLIRETTFTDGTTRLEVTARDGSVLSTTGTAEHGVRYDYGVTNDGGIYRLYQSTIRLNTNGTDSAEVVTTFNRCDGGTYKTIHAGAATNTMEFNTLGQMVKSTDPDGVAMLYGYNPLGEQVVSAVDVNRNGVIDTNGTDRVTVMTRSVLTNPESYVVQRTVTQVYSVDSSSASVIATTNETSATGLRSWNRTAAGVSTRVTAYPGSGQRTVTSTAHDGSYSVTFYQDGRMLSMTRYDALGTQLAQNTADYDAFGRAWLSTDSVHGTRTNFFDTVNRVYRTSTAAPASGQSPLNTTNYFDGRDRVFRMVHPDGNSVTNEFFLTGELKKTYGSRTYPVAYTYDHAGRLKTMTTWQSFATSGGAAVTTWNYDGYQGLLTNKQYQGGSGPSYTYTPSGKLKTRTWARGVVTSYGYNNAGDLQSLTYSDGITPAVTNSYNRLGQIVSQTQSLGGTNVVRTTGFSLLALPLTESWTGGPLDGLSVTNGFDNLQRRTTVGLSNYSASVAVYGYDRASRLAGVTNGSAFAAYTYSADRGQWSKLQMGLSGTNRLTTSRVYDKVDRLTWLTNAYASTDVFGFAFNAAGQMTRRDEPDGAYWIYTYDSLGQVTSGKKYWSDSSPVAGQQFEYAFDDIGNRNSSASGGDASGSNLRSTSYSVNLLNQYSSRNNPSPITVIGSAVTNATVTVNLNSTVRKGEYWWGEATATNTYYPARVGITNVAVIKGAGTNGTDLVSTNTGALLWAEASETFTNDLDGNLMADSLWTYTWDGENRLIRMESRSAVPLDFRRRLDMTYDAGSRRIGQTISTWTNNAYASAKTKRFVSDGWNLLAELDVSKTLVQAYVWGTDLSGSMTGAGGVGGLLMVNTGSASHGYAYNSNGDVRSLVSLTDGGQSAAYEYGPFGELIRSSGAMALSNPFRFSTKHHDEESALLYYGYRYYDSRAGRWINMDPIGELAFFLQYARFHNATELLDERPVGLNLHLFISNNPIGNTDMDGCLMTPGGEVGKTKENRRTPPARMELIQVPKCTILFVYGHNYVDDFEKTGLQWIWNIVPVNDNDKSCSYAAVAGCAADRIPNEIPLPGFDYSTYDVAEQRQIPAPVLLRMWTDVRDGLPSFAEGLCDQACECKEITLSAKKIGNLALTIEKGPFKYKCKINKKSN